MEGGAAQEREEISWCTLGEGQGCAQNIMIKQSRTNQMRDPDPDSSVLCVRFLSMLCVYGRKRPGAPGVHL